MSATGAEIVIAILVVCVILQIGVLVNGWLENKKKQERIKPLEEDKKFKENRCKHNWVLTGEVSGREHKAKCTRCSSTITMMMNPDDGYKYCENCGGKGNHKELDYDGFGGFNIESRKPCETCDSSGQVPTIETRLERVEKEIDNAVECPA